MKITVIGTGYVGLVSGVCFAEFGFNVVCVDNNIAKVESLQRGELCRYVQNEDALKRNYGVLFLI